MRLPLCFVFGLTIAAASALHASVAWKDVLRQPQSWYGTAEAKVVASNVLVYQRPEGGWPKNHDMTQPPSADAFAQDDISAPTIDNDTTYTQIRLLAAVDAAQSSATYREAITRGLKYLLEAQYKNGGWPQFYPLRPGYYTHITFNDDAMTGVLELLEDVAEKKDPFGWVEPELRARSANAVERGVACILRCQIEVNGVKTVWCAQHDEITFEPVPARAYEHESLSGSESVGIVRFLMRLDHPSPQIVDAIKSAVAWFERSRIMGIRVESVPAPQLPHGFDKRVVDDAKAGPLWARFYEINTNRPIFGGRDTRIHYTLAEVEPERRAGYRWYTDRPQRLIERDFPVWSRRWLSEQTAGAPSPSATAK
ncbi:MAG TPA: pectate lyase [Opitutaceae bacterium]